MQENVKKALILYSDDHMDEMLAPKIQQNIEKMNELLKKINNCFVRDENGKINYATLPSTLEEPKNFYQVFWRVKLLS